MVAEQDANVIVLSCTSISNRMRTHSADVITEIRVFSVTDSMPGMSREERFDSVITRPKEKSLKNDNIEK